jgi:hypothetical protein
MRHFSQSNSLISIRLPDLQSNLVFVNLMAFAKISMPQSLFVNMFSKKMEGILEILLGFNRKS